MRFLLAIIDSLVSFVQRNPLTVLVILILAIGAPAVLKGVALFILYLFMGLLVLILVGLLLLRWHMNKIRRQMEEQFGAGERPQDGPWRGRNASAGPTSGREGEVRVHRTSEAPEKRVSKDVGDYIDFEEEKR
ncbi:MAG TPA: DUF4834 family protein [Candidatus Alistipes intestinipullorum]|nr:DUF4834 family protein [Candidatus Alistipes intestinipullorum]